MERNYSGSQFQGSRLASDEGERLKILRLGNSQANWFEKCTV